MNNIKEEKELYKLFNQVQQFDENELDNMDKEMTDIQLERVKKNLRKNIVKGGFKMGMKKRKIIILAAALVVTVTTVAFAEGDIFGIRSSIENIMESKNVIKDYGSVINKTVTKNGVDVTIEEVFMDNENLMARVVLKSDKFKDYPYQQLYAVPVASISSGKGEFKKLQESDVNYTAVEKLDDTTISGLFNCNLNGNAPKNDIKVKIDFNELMLMTKTKTVAETIKGSWNFQFSSSREKLAANTKTISLNKEVKVNSGEITKKVKLNDIKITPLAVSIEYLNDVAINGKKINANDYEKYSKDEIAPLNVEILDQNGNNLLAQDETKISKNNHFSSSIDKPEGKVYIDKFLNNSNKITKLKINIYNRDNKKIETFEVDL